MKVLSVFEECCMYLFLGKRLLGRYSGYTRGPDEWVIRRRYDRKVIGYHYEYSQVTGKKKKASPAPIPPNTFTYGWGDDATSGRKNSGTKLSLEKFSFLARLCSFGFRWCCATTTSIVASSNIPQSLAPLTDNGVLLHRLPITH